MNHSISGIRLFAAVAVLLAGSSKAQILTTTYANTFESADNTAPFTGGSVGSWVYWYGLNYNNTPMTNDPSMDAQGNPDSGSLMVYLPFGNTSDQGVFFGTFGNQYGYDSSVHIDARQYSSLSFDIHFAPGTPVNAAGNLGTITMSIFPDGEGGGDFSLFPNVTIPASATNGWFHATESIANFLAQEPILGLTNCSAMGFNYNSYGGYPTSPVTFWIDNIVVSSGTVAAPVLEPGGGPLTNGQSVTIITATAGASIRYTLDGTIPSSTSGTLYAGPIQLNLGQRTTLKAIAYAPGLADSPVVSTIYYPFESMNVGINLDGVADWSAAWPFVDLFKRTRTWMTRNLNGSGAWDSGFGGLVPVDTNGWPTQVPFPVNGTNQMVHTILTRFNEPGTYDFVYEGTGTLLLGWSPGGTLQLTARGGVHTNSFTITSETSQAWVEIHSSATNDYLRNFHIVSTKYLSNYTAQPFHPLFLARLQPFKCLRFMDWGSINNSPLVSWTNRTTPSYYTQANPNGVALEYMIQLCNALQKDAWLCIPHQADDDYVQHAAELFLDNLDPNLRLHVEYSNETWNYGFAQATYVQTQGTNLGLDPTPLTAGQKYVALRSAQIWNIFEQTLGNTNASRLVKVMATQTGWPTITQMRLSGLLDTNINPAGVLPDALAIAPYFGKQFSPADLPPNAPYPTVDEVLTNLAVQGIADQLGYVREQKSIADSYGLFLECYEGGQTFLGISGAENDTNLTAIVTTANRDPRMFDRYTEYLNMLQSQEVSLFDHYSYCGTWTKYGSWGSLEYQDQPTNQTPKYNALVEWIDTEGPPVIAQQPQSQSVAQGQDILLSVTASGARPLSYQWQFDGSDIPGATAMTLALTNIQISDSGSYTVVLTNLEGNTTSTVATITVAIPPSITVPPQDQTVVQGADVDFKVTASGTEPLSYQWWFKGVPIAGARTNILTLGSVTISNAGAYSVTVSNIVGAVTSVVATLTVEIPVAITQQPQNVTSVAGSDATFTIVATGTQPLSYQWWFNDNALAGASTNTLALNGVTISNAGDYSVTVSNIVGAVTSFVATLTVEIPAAITQQPQNTTAIAGTNVTFSVGALGTAPLSYQWWYNGVPIAGATSSALVLSSVTISNAGNYSVTVSNVVGAVTSLSATLTVNVAVTIIQQPLSVIAGLGTNVTFAVAATGTEPLSYQWLFNGRTIPGETSATLSLNLVTMTNAGTYSVIVSNVVGAVTSSNAVLAVEPPFSPTISSALLIGATFSATISSQPGVIYILEATDDMQSANWTALELAPGTGSVIVLSDTNAVATSRFYRIKAQ